MKKSWKIAAAAGVALVAAAGVNAVATSPDHDTWCAETLTEARDLYSDMFYLSYGGSPNSFDQQEYDAAQRDADVQAGKYLADEGYYERGCPDPAVA